MDAAHLLKAARRRAGLSLRDLAIRAKTSHSALAAYEAGRKVPSVATLDRIITAAGLELLADIRPGVPGATRAARGDELVEVLELAALFPARHDRELAYPRFGGR